MCTGVGPRVAGTARFDCRCSVFLLLGASGAKGAGVVIVRLDEALAARERRESRREADAVSSDGGKRPDIGRVTEIRGDRLRFIVTISLVSHIDTLERRAFESRGRCVMAIGIDRGDIPLRNSVTPAIPHISVG